MSQAKDPWVQRDKLNKLGVEADRLPLLREQLLDWHRDHGRHDLPWKSQDPYWVMVSEVMLQQTQVSTIRHRFPAWMEKFPTIEALAQAPESEVMKAWEGLGYYQRARRLHAAAQHVMSHHGGRFPKNREERLSLPGIGPSTASAIGAFAFGEREAIWDGNVQRIWQRWWGDRALPLSNAERTKFWWGWSTEAMPEDSAGIRQWTQAVMDLGATLCTPKKPACHRCPWVDSCRAKELNEVERWPVKVKKTQVQPWRLVWAKIVNHEGQWAWVQNPSQGVWAGLWVLPEVTWEASYQVIHQGQHLLSHRKISYEIREYAWSEIANHVDETWQWLSPEQALDLALPKPLVSWMKAS